MSNIKFAALVAGIMIFSGTSASAEPIITGKYGGSYQFTASRDGIVQFGGSFNGYSHPSGWITCKLKVDGSTISERTNGNNTDVGQNNSSECSGTFPVEKGETYRLSAEQQDKGTDMKSSSFNVRYK